MASFVIVMIIVGVLGYIISDKNKIVAGLASAAIIGAPLGSLVSSLLDGNTLTLMAVICFMCIIAGISIGESNKR